ncbi:MAG: methyltransferase family protein [Woeseiaceae bacterium]
MTAIVCFAYALLLLELLFLHVPSVASSRNILVTDAGSAEDFSPRIRKVFGFGIFRKTLQYVLPLLLVYATFAFPLLVIWTENNPLNDNLFVPSVWVQSSGILLLLAGRAVTLVTSWRMRRLSMTSNQTSQLDTGGVFRRSRNPGLVGMYAFIIGIWLNIPSISMAIGIIVYIVYMHQKVRIEEDFLSHRFGDEYDKYCRETGRYLF